MFLLPHDQLPFHCQWQDLKDLFRQAGTVLRADVVLGPDGRSRGFGTVVFATDYDADVALKMFNGSALSIFTLTRLMSFTGGTTMAECSKFIMTSLLQRARHPRNRCLLHCLRLESLRLISPSTILPPSIITQCHTPVSFLRRDIAWTLDLPQGQVRPMINTPLGYISRSHSMSI